MSSAFHDFRLQLPNAPAQEQGAVKVWEASVELPTWLPAAPDQHPMFLEKRVYQGSSGRVYPLPVIDRIATEPIMHRWRAIHLENAYVRLMILPELGGRIHVGFDKRNGYDFFYRQDVIKPALVGLAGPWISGGVEFNWPQHHRPATFMAVETAIERGSDGSATLWCSDHDPMARMKGMHGVCLHPERALVELRVRLHNRTADTQTFLWWANAATRVHERYQSFFPQDVSHAADHARRALTAFPLSESVYYGVDYERRGREGVPAKEEPRCNRPDGSYAANDLSWYANIPVPTSYMISNSSGDYFGGYDHALEAGLVHVANHHIAPGKKQWTWGNQEFGYAWDRCLTESGGPYIELMAGVYTDNQPDFSFLAPGETKSFTQIWFPVREIGLPDFANAHGAIHVQQSAGQGTVRLLTTGPVKAAALVVKSAGKTVATWQGELGPEAMLELPFVYRDERLEVRLSDGERTLLCWSRQNRDAGPALGQTKVETTEQAPGLATEPAKPSDVKNADELYMIGQHLEQYRHPTRRPELYWQEALRRDAGDSRCNLAMGRWHMRRGEFELAEVHLRRAILRQTSRNQNPADGEAFYVLAQVLHYLQKPDEAYAAWYKASWNAGWSAAAFLRLAEMDSAQGRMETALEHVDRSLSRDVENLTARCLKAIVLQQLGQKAESAKVLQKTLALDPLDAMTLFLATGKIPADGQARLDLVFDLMRWGQWALALNLSSAEKVEQPNGAATMLLYARAAVLMRMGRKPEADAVRVQASVADRAYVFPARLAEMLLLQEAIEQNPMDGNAPYYLGNLYYDRRRRAEAIALWEQAVALLPANAIAWRNLGIAYCNVQFNAGKADAAFGQARALAPNNARLLFEHDQLAKRIGRPLVQRLAVLEAHPHMVRQRDDLAVELAALLNSAGRAEDALQLLSGRIFQPWVGGEGAVLQQYVRALLLLSVAALLRGNATLAIKHLELALEPPENLGETWHTLANTSQVFYWLGVAHASSGQDLRAKACWLRAAGQVQDFQRMKVQAVSEMSVWSALALKCLGESLQADELLNRILNYAKQLVQNKAEIDYFATSLPMLLLFEADLDVQQKVQALQLEMQAAYALSERARGEAARAELLQLANSHAAALDWPVLWQAVVLQRKADQPTAEKEAGQ